MKTLQKYNKFYGSFMAYSGLFHFYLNRKWPNLNYALVGLGTYAFLGHDAFYTDFRFNFLFIISGLIRNHKDITCFYKYMKIFPYVPYIIGNTGMFGLALRAALTQE